MGLFQARVRQSRGPIENHGRQRQYDGGRDGQHVHAKFVDVRGSYRRARGDSNKGGVVSSVAPRVVPFEAYHGMFYGQLEARLAPSASEGVSFAA